MLLSFINAGDREQKTGIRDRSQGKRCCCHQHSIGFLMLHCEWCCSLSCARGLIVASFQCIEKGYEEAPHL